MNFWKKHLTIRAILIILFFALGLVLTFIGWGMTGQLLGLGIMLVGVILLLASLFLYNATYK